MSAAALEREGRQEIPLGLLAFLATVVMLFTAFTGSLLIRRTAADWERIPLPGGRWATTAVLAASSATLEAARRSGSRRLLASTIGLGIAFLIGQVLVWQSLARAGFYLPSNPHASFVYVLTALHGLHLAGGVAALGLTALGRVRPGSAALYWHFMGAVWVYVFFVLSVL